MRLNEFFNVISLDRQFPDTRCKIHIDHPAGSEIGSGRFLFCHMGYLAGVPSGTLPNMQCLINPYAKQCTDAHIVHCIDTLSNKHCYDCVMIGFANVAQAMHAWFLCQQSEEVTFGGMSSFDWNTFESMACNPVWQSNEHPVAMPLSTRTLYVTMGLLDLNCIKEDASPVPGFQLDPKQINDYLEAMKTLPFMTRHQMSPAAKKIFTQIYGKSRGWYAMPGDDCNKKVKK